MQKYIINYNINMGNAIKIKKLGNFSRSVLSGFGDVQKFLHDNKDITYSCILHTGQEMS